jgi:catechol-2,3-dioxygenase
MNAIAKNRPIKGGEPIRHDKAGDVTQLPSPRYIGHLSFLTNDNFEAMKDFYRNLVNAEMVNEVPGFLYFPSFDGEHHRFAIIKVQTLKPKSASSEKTVGLNHVAFSFSSLADVLFVYRHMKARGHVPTYCCNHGTTTSLYYQDPDGNEAEIFVDNFDTSPEVVNYKLTTQFLSGFGEMSEGNFDPDKMVALFEGGMSDSVLRDRTEVRRLVKEGKL